VVLDSWTGGGWLSEMIPRTNQPHKILNCTEIYVVGQWLVSLSEWVVPCTSSPDLSVWGARYCIPPPLTPTLGGKVCWVGVLVFRHPKADCWPGHYLKLILVTDHQLPIVKTNHFGSVSVCFIGLGVWVFCPNSIGLVIMIIWHETNEIALLY
jgi:hypothetical protein